MSREGEALDVYADLVERRPHDSRHLACYGGLLAAWRRPEAARILQRGVAEGRAEVALKPDDALAHRNLAYALKNLGKLEESVEEFRKAISLEPDDPLTHLQLGDALLIQKKLDEAVISYREAIGLKADYADAHQQLGQALMVQGNNLLAAAECREAIRLKPDAAESHVLLGLALSAMQKGDEAMAEIRRAQRLNPDYPEAHCSMGMVLSNLGEFATAAAEARAGAELRSKRSGQPIFPEDRHWIASLDRQAAIVSRLPAIAKGDDPPDDIDEQLFLAEVAYIRKFFATAARLWSRAVDAKPALGDDRKAQHRYNAACAAALAAAGQGKNEACPDAAARVNLRRQALACLKMELAAWAKVLDFGNPQEVAAIVLALQHWQEDADLVSIRDRAELDSLPADEQRAWRALWSDVAALLAKALACSKH